MTSGYLMSFFGEGSLIKQMSIPDLNRAELLSAYSRSRWGILHRPGLGTGDMRLLKIIRQYLKPEQLIFIGLISRIGPRVSRRDTRSDLPASAIYSRTTTRNHWRLRFLAILQRYLDYA